MSSTLRPSVSVCIPTFNQAPFLIQAIESVLHQTYPNVTIFISDDASTDETQVLMQQYLQHPRITYYRQPYNLGISANNNWLLSQPETDYIIRLDSDDLLLPSYTQTLLDLFAQYPEAGYAHAAVNEIDAENTQRRVRRLFGRSEYQDSIAAIKAGLTGYRVAANICMFKRNVLHEMNFYKPGMNFCEDWELSIRIADGGYGNIYCSVPLACYRVWSDQENVRANRKVTEIKGAYELYQNTYLPIYSRRHWPLSIVEKQKNTYALNHSICLAQDNFTLHDKTYIKSLLILFTNKKNLVFRIWMIESGLFGLILYTKKIKVAVKDLIKSILYSKK